ncbi:MAG TPA: Stp1/IreP family PP2C-type Ser/Thr phosphatase [Steroidobacteraceae bacterium]|nr:Stp1/IreP family PP2C-type Ser/Thr phosphatase [Steroidobacteraceae bacterium]
MYLRGKLDCVGMSDTGRVREHNEDTIGTDPGIGLVVLADGMGGYKAGEVASGIAVRTVMGLIKDAVDREDLGTTDAQTGLSRPGILLRDAIQRANKIIYQTAKTQAHCEGMGTTVAAGLFFDDRLTMAHVGDSRVYRVRGGRIEQLTRDHSLLEELIARGFYTPEEAQRAATRNYVTRALGVETTVDVEITEIPVARDDVFLLCSDGLSDMVEDEDIQLTVNTFGDNLEKLARQLVLLSNENGGRDNVSLVLVRVMESFPARRGVFDRVLRLFG